ncbi:hypothetical protein PAXRUDRAFT_9384 [Paxillus rubicundulus Ve08.2h10]|uniref:Uncharacterized protein n=1 Tax=Paxillus rubicundulus Ve08.2h10 TaxID=930991 RepID=A0A0D0E8P1_9AGAM|nr:hypothetical protein PAXRUDRAFT_9384 [Paxillus rubicundulus Ve08.2h10]
MSLSFALIEQSEVSPPPPHTDISQIARVAENRQPVWKKKWTVIPTNGEPPTGHHQGATNQCKTEVIPTRQPPMVAPARLRPVYAQEME